MIDLAAPKFQRLIPDFFVYGYGTDAEPGTTEWMISLVAPLGARLREGIRILDYGCGGGRFFNFLTGYLADFHYYGAEPAGGKELAIAKSFFEADPRATFLACEEAVARLDELQPDAVILGSVFTHLRAETCERIVESLMPVVERGGSIVFSAMFADKADYGGAGAHGFADCYGAAYQDWGWPERLEQRVGRPVKRVGKFDVAGITSHLIFIIE